MKILTFQSFLKRDKLKTGTLAVDSNKSIEGTFVNNICQNTQLPKSCEGLPASFFYFAYKENNSEKCVSLITTNSNEYETQLESLEPTNSFTLLPKNGVYKFQTLVRYNQKYNYPVNTIEVLDGKTTFIIESKFCKGVTNGSAQKLEQSKVISSIVFIFIGLFILASAGISFKRMIAYIAVALFFILALFFVFTYFNFQLNSTATTVIMGFIVGVSVLIKLIINKVKKLFNALVTLLSVKIGYTYGEIVFPNSPLHERVY